jgi:hypothetical protein
VRTSLSKAVCATAVIFAAASRVCARQPSAGIHAARDAISRHAASAQRARQTHYAARRLRHQPAQTEARGTSLRVDEDHWAVGRSWALSNVGGLV